MLVATSFVQEDVGHSVIGRTESSVPDPFVQAGFLKLSQESAVSKRVRSTDPDRRSRMVGHNNA